MIHEILNTLYVQAQGAYLRLDHETVKVEHEGAQALQVPLHHLGGVIAFGNVLVSPFLLHKCAEDQRSVAWFTQSGRFKARLVGPTSGNVLLRLAQWRAHESEALALALAREIVAGKIRNSRTVILRAARERGTEGTPPAQASNPSADLAAAAEALSRAIPALADARDVEAVRGIEGASANAYFASFRSLVPAPFLFEGRVRRPPRDPVNALLSFGYSLLANECVGALEGVGLDPQVGFLHAIRPGRPALALDLMEEFRSIIADRAALTLLNRRELDARHFEHTEGGAVHLTDEGRRTFLKHWQIRKQETVEHPILKQSVPIGLLPHVQARLLARHLRGDLAEYRPFAAR